MIIDEAKNPCGLVYVFNSRTRYDRNVAEERGGSPVFRSWVFARRALGEVAWRTVTRVALFDYGEDVTGVALDQKRRELRKYLKAQKPKLVVCVPPRTARSRDKEMEIAENKGLKGHQAWVAAKAPGPLGGKGGIEGTIFEAPWGPTMGIVNPINTDFAGCGLVRRHMVGGYAFATGRAQILRPNPDDVAWMPDDKARALLARILEMARVGETVAFDIENVPSTKQITCIGVAAGLLAVSVPWESFKIAGGTAMEPEGPTDMQDMVRAILASDCPKVTHNGRGHDVPFLAKKGIPVGGFVHDTIAACAAISNQYPKNLQSAVSSEFLVPPWKTMHHSKDYDIDSDEAWTADPVHLREYNVLDTWYDLRLWNAQRNKMGLWL